MFFPDDFDTPEEPLPKATGPRLFFRFLGQETVALLLLNVIFLLSCIPVVTIPPAVLALWRVVRRILANCGIHAWQHYREAFCQTWKQGYAAFALTGLPLLLAGYGAWFYLRLAETNFLCYLPFLFCSTVFLTALLTSPYLYGLLAAGRPLDRETALLSLKLGLGKPLRAILAAVGWHGALAAGILLLPLSGLWLLMAGISVPCLLAQFLIRTVLERFVPEEAQLASEEK